MAKKLREFTDGAITETTATAWCNSNYDESQTGATANRWAVQVAWQNGAGSYDSGDKVQVIGSLGSQSTVISEVAIESTDNTADATIFNVDIPLEAVKVNTVLSGITSLELQIEVLRIR